MRYLLLSSLLLCGLVLSAQETEEPITEASETDDIYLPAFPEAYTGRWTGDLEIFNHTGRVQMIAMGLDILPINDSTYTYTITYGKGKDAQRRDYLLRAGEQGDHHWVIDEQDGILLDNFYVGGTLHGPFSVMGNMLYSSLEKRGIFLVYSISSGPARAFRQSGTTTTDQEGQEQQIDVEAFQISNYQRAFLRKDGF